MPTTPTSLLACLVIENAYQSGEVIQVTTGQFTYDIDPARMKQTRSKRRIDRRLKRMTTIKAEDSERVLERLKTHISKIAYEVPFASMLPGILEQHLLKMARQDFVVAKREAGRENVILLKGMNSVVARVEQQLDHDIIEWLRD